MVDTSQIQQEMVLKVLICSFLLIYYSSHVKNKAIVTALSHELI